VVATTDNGVLADPVSAPSITPTTTPAYVVSMIGGAGAVGAIHAPFTELMPLYGDDTAYVITTTAGAYGAIWDDTNTGAYEASTVAFKPAKR
jgi:hypothetical protein